MSIIEKIKNFFSNLFSKNEIKTLDVPENKIETNEKEDNFLDSIKVKDNSYTISLTNKILKNEMKIKDLTDSELDDMISYYKNKLATN